MWSILLITLLVIRLITLSLPQSLYSLPVNYTVFVVYIFSILICYWPSLCHCLFFLGLCVTLILSKTEQITLDSQYHLNSIIRNVFGVSVECSITYLWQKQSRVRITEPVDMKTLCRHAKHCLGYLSKYTTAHKLNAMSSYVFY